MALPILPEHIAESFSGGPNYNTSIVTKFGGKESRNRVWIRPRWEFEFATTALPIDEIRTIVSFHHGARGRWLPWLLTDPLDNEVVDEPIGTGDGSTTTFQALITYQDELGLFPPFYRAINFLRLGSLTTKVDGVVASSSATYDGGSGIITFDVAPANGLVVTASFKFYVAVRFSVDKADAEVIKADDAFSGLARVRGLGAIEDHDPVIDLLELA